MGRDAQGTEALELTAHQSAQDAWQRTYAFDGDSDPGETASITTSLPSAADAVAARRTHADRQAAWRRWHADVTEPTLLSEKERVWYHVFEQARVEELASRELRGMAHNLAQVHGISTESALQARLYRLARRCFAEGREQPTDPLAADTKASIDGGRWCTPPITEAADGAGVGEGTGVDGMDALITQNQRHTEVPARVPHQRTGWIRRWFHRPQRPIRSEVSPPPSDQEMCAALHQARLHLQNGTRFASVLWPLIQRLAVAPIAELDMESAPAEPLGCPDETDVTDDAEPAGLSEPQTEPAPEVGDEMDSEALAPHPAKEEAEDSSTTATPSDPALEIPYRPFTTQWDEERPARHFCTPEDLTTLQGLDPADQARMRRLALRLQRQLLSARQRRWQFDQDSGRLDSRRLARLLVPGAPPRVFREEQVSPVPEACVTLLVDQSGSMRGRPQQIAVQAIDLAVQTLEACRISCEVLGYTTVDGEDNPVVRSWRAHGQPKRPGRLNALRQLIYKSASDPWRRARPSLGLMLRADFGRENLDGEALDWAARRLVARPEPRKILLVLSDASPYDAATVVVHGRGYLETHLRQVIANIDASAIQLVAIGTSHRVGYYYRKAVVLHRHDTVADTLFAQLGELLSPSDPSRRP
jgi:cobaltochelatase CobT